MAMGTTPAVPIAQTRVRDAYGFALALILTATLMLVASGSPLVSPVAGFAIVLQFVALYLTLRVSGFQGKISRILAVAFAFSLALALIGVPLVGDFGRIAALFAWLLLLVTTVVAISRRLVTYHEVTVPLLMGLLVIYVVVGLMFAAGFQIADLLFPPGLKPEGQGISGAVYFSFVTLATLGYGDVTPGNDVTRAMAIAEALIGQLYLVSVVSLAVSRLRSPRSDVALEEQPAQENQTPRDDV